EKLGVNIDTVKTAKYATAFSPLLPWSSEEGVFAQKQTDMVYEKFLTVVSKGRHQSKDDIHAIAQGRVWSGARAKSNGLVDQIGDLNDAMNCAARLAKLEKYKISEYPLVKDSWTKLIEEISNEDSNTEDILLKKYFKSWYPAVTYFKQMDQDYFKPKMLMPFQLLLK
ncbi:MAG: S49 family peptidase, partial [Saprospiraceae bacterium]|nr:S49 family peptidase [Saprospiraceae bacterium]